MGGVPTLKECAISIVINFKKTETSKQSSPDTYEIGDGLGIP